MRFFMLSSMHFAKLPPQSSLTQMCFAMHSRCTLQSTFQCAFRNMYQSTSQSTFQCPFRAPRSSSPTCPAVPLHPSQRPSTLISPVSPISSLAPALCRLPFGPSPVRGPAVFGRIARPSRPPPSLPPPRPPPLTPIPLPRRLASPASRSAASSRGRQCARWSKRTLPNEPSPTSSMSR